MVRAEEELMVRIIGFTYGGEVHFRGVPQNLSSCSTRRDSMLR